jgi:2-polyprenyl-3-methyl-5-hydroxy-6-metoxy-1,4-benzoquinol methylase
MTRGAAPSLKEELLPDQLDALWHRVDEHELSPEEFDARYQGFLDQYRDSWEQALLLEGHSSLKDSLLTELDSYFGGGKTETETRCREASGVLQRQWRDSVVDGSRASIEAFYDTNVTCLYDLMWWHNLKDDDDPLAYVLALRFGDRQGCSRCLDFGAGVGSGSILFARNGMEVTHADLSSVSLAFSKWRFELRELPVTMIDTKVDALPSNYFQLVTAMDTLEHLVDPLQTIEQLWKCLAPGGILLGRFYTNPKDARPQHIVRDFAPTLERMAALGLVEVWRDDWLWGHRAFRKS